MDTVAALPTLEALRAYVLTALCHHDALDPNQTPLLQAVIARRGKPCGLMFEVRGPRLLRASAVWAGDENRLFFYDSSGMRFGDVRLSEAPDPLKLVA